VTKSAIPNDFIPQPVGVHYDMKTIIYISTFLFLTSCDFKSSEYYNGEAEKFEKEGKYKEAIPLLDKAIKKDPKNIYALTNRGVDKSILEDYNGAISDYTKIIEIDSNNTLAYLNRGKNKKRLNDFLGAIEDFDKAIDTKGSEMLYLDKVENYFIDTGFEFDVKMEEIRFERGIARYNIDSVRLAYDDFVFCYQINYEKPACLYWIGLIYIAYNLNDEACKAFKNSEKLGDPDAKEMIIKYCNK
jgi:tetratricopeptide (TPR) repeat protein